MFPFFDVFLKKRDKKFWRVKEKHYLCTHFRKEAYMVDVVQSVRASDCGSECRGFESHPPPIKKE